MTQDIPGTTQLDQHLAHMDNAVAEVFEAMLRQPCGIIDEAPRAPCTISAEIAFSQSVEGLCLVSVSTSAARTITSAMLGIEREWEETIVQDAVGELCNLIAGGWKSRLCGGAARCGLSAPFISIGAAPMIPIQHSSVLRRYYSFQSSAIEVTLIVR